MNYELAKELKDAGFPQNGEGIFEGGEGTDELPDVYSPTVEELIEACGDRLEAIIQQTGTGVAVDSAEHYMVKLSSYQSSTPTEAVARLWLALQ